MGSTESTCCPKGSWESLPTNFDDQYKEQGEVVTLRKGKESLPVYYVTNGSSPKQVIMIFTDVFGFTSRVKSICDTLSSTLQCTVIMPDNLRGDKMNPKKNFIDFCKKYPYDPLLQEDIEACVTFLTSKELFDSNTCLGFIGFCWGAWIVAKALAAASKENDKAWCKSVKCGVGLHPSIRVEEMVFKADLDKLMTSISYPLLLCTAGNDPENMKKGPLVKHLESKGGKSFDYPEMKHGWVARGDLNMEDVVRDANDALEKTTQFFHEKLK